MAASLDFAAMQQRLAARERLVLTIDGYRPTAVLLALLDDRILFTRRPTEFRSHAGQISFPGGKRDPGDVDLVATALREAEEEVGLDPASLTVLGLLDDVPTPTGYIITPVVARAPAESPLRPSEREVAEVFLADVAALAAPAAYRCGDEQVWMGITFIMHEYEWEGRRIWGATARILHQFLGVLHGDERQRP